MKKLVQLWKRLGLRGLWQLGVYTLQKRRGDRLYHSPLYAQIETTKGCNLQCRVCGLSHYRVKGGHMSLENFERALDQLTGIQEVMLQGLGEPLLNRDFVDIVRAAKARGLRVSTTTNGTLLTREIGAGLIDAGLDLMSVSLDGTTAETFELIRIGTKFEPVLNNLRAMGELKRELGVDHPQLNIGFILTNHNYHQLPDLIQLADEIGVTKVNVWRLQGGDVYADIGNLSLETLDEEAVKPVFAETRRVATELGVELELPPMKRIYNAPICDWPWRGTYVTWDGYLTPCCVICYSEIHNFGNLLQEDMKDIWNGPKYQAFRAQLRSDNPSSLCKECPYKLPWMAKLKHKRKAEDLLLIQDADATPAPAAQDATPIPLMEAAPVSVMDEGQNSR